MQTDLPIACSLSADELARRLAQMAALGRAALIDTRVETTHAELRFAPDPGIQARVQAIATAESHCCAFLAMRVREDPDAVVLEIDAPEDAGLVLTELVDAFRGSERATR